MCCAALVFKEDILFNNHHHRCCYLRDDEDETKLFTSWAGPEMCGLRARRRATMAFLKRYREGFLDGRHPKLFSSKRLSFFFSHACEIQKISDQKRLKRE